MLTKLIGAYLILDGVWSVRRYRKQGLSEHAPRYLRSFIGYLMLFISAIPQLIPLWITLDGIGSYFMYQRQKLTEHIPRMMRFGVGITLLSLPLPF